MTVLYLRRDWVKYPLIQNYTQSSKQNLVPSNNDIHLQNLRKSLLRNLT